MTVVTLNEPSGSVGIRPKPAGLLRGEAAASADAVLPLVLTLTRRATLVERARRDFRYRLLLTAWRSVHLELSLGLLAALLIHVVVVFYNR